MDVTISLDHPSSIYGIFPIDPTTIMVQDLVCFCPTYFKEQWEGCLNKAHVFSWQLIKFKPSNTRLVKEQVEEFDDPNETEFSGDGEKLFNLLQVGDNFVVLVVEGNVEGVNFYILQCQHQKFMVSEPFASVWGCEFDIGDYVVAKTYYQKWGWGN
jgi:hypothetical protein